eukprot:TRINITY_DN204_c0_g2_i1.p1 TRINITY_DN204_c0_g2~~TRINITY_DN204_c0_g2_i1.p1  ORF type:complete len:248 (-),score=72.94 TRINITY_DN204_c0_g2_i1:214-900(-)
MFACRACTGSNPVTYTVKVSFPPPGAEDKENCDLRNIDTQTQREKKAAEERRRREEAVTRAEEERRLASLLAQRAEFERRLVEQKLLEERKRLEAEEAARVARAAAEAKEAARLQRLREEEERLRAERELKVEEERRKQYAADSAKLWAFLIKHGYKDANTKRTKLFKYKYPLHSAVKLNDASIVKLLLAQGADPTVKNSAGQTPTTVAQNLQKGGSHKAVIALIQGC